MNCTEKTDRTPERWGAAVGPDTTDIVMGLHWDPPEGAPRTIPGPANLDALCFLFDVEGRVLEIIHPGRLRTANSSVLHTGDSRTGASIWDDERIFVFLRALPDAVDALTFTVVSVDGRAFCDIAAASCHVSNHGTDEVLLDVELTALGRLTHYCVATLVRSATGWRIHRGAPHDQNATALLSMASAPYAAPAP